MLRSFLREVCSDWVALVSGIASFLLMAAGAISSESLPGWVFWPAAYVCLLVAAYRVWAKQYTARQAAEAKLAGASLEPERERQAVEEVARLTTAESNFLRRVLVGDQVPVGDAAASPGADRLERAGLIRRDFVGYWSVNPHFRPSLERLLPPGPAKAAPGGPNPPGA